MKKNLSLKTTVLLFNCLFLFSGFTAEPAIIKNTNAAHRKLLQGYATLNFSSIVGNYGVIYYYNLTLKNTSTGSTYNYSMGTSSSPFSVSIPNGTYNVTLSTNAQSHVFAISGPSNYLLLSNGTTAGVITIIGGDTYTIQSYFS